MERLLDQDKTTCLHSLLCHQFTVWHWPNPSPLWTSIPSTITRTESKVCSLTNNPFFFFNQFHLLYYSFYKIMWRLHLGPGSPSRRLWYGSSQDGQWIPDMETWWTPSLSRSHGWDNCRSWKRHQKWPWRSCPGGSAAPGRSVAVVYASHQQQLLGHGGETMPVPMGAGMRCTSTETQWPVTLQRTVWGLLILLLQ